MNETLHCDENGEKSLLLHATTVLFFNSLRGRSRTGHGGGTGAGPGVRGKRSLLGWKARQAKEEGGAKPKLALTTNVPAMGMDDMLGNRQPQTRPPGRCV